MAKISIPRSKYIANFTTLDGTHPASAHTSPRASNPPYRRTTSGNNRWPPGTAYVSEEKTGSDQLGQLSTLHLQNFDVVAEEVAA